MRDEFPDGVWVFELAAVTDPATVPDAVAAVLGITQQPRKTVSESVAAALEGRVRLLVFDNCEHVLDAAGDLIDAILARSATVTILATSREGLRVADEQQWPVPTLEVRTEVDSSATTLFVERARAVAPGTAFAGDEAASVVEICRQLDGIPLAIELAASRMASMTATEVRDRLDDRFRLLVGSRRAPQHHHTLRHAVQWSYDLLDGAEKTLLNRCSVFVGGFDLQAAHAVSGSPDDLATLDLLDALVRKSLLIADRSSGRTRFSMLETIRRFAEEQLVHHGKADEARTAQARYFAGREADILALWDSRRQREAYEWFGVELSNLRAAFRWAADHRHLDTAISIATYAAFLGSFVENYEPTAWVEELIEPARVVDHPRLAFLNVMASQCYLTGRIQEAVNYGDACQAAVGSGRDEVPYGVEGWLVGPYLSIGQPDRAVELCRAQLARGRDSQAFATACWVVALAFAGSGHEARAATSGLTDAAEATGNPFVLSFALFAQGLTFSNTDPHRALDALRRGLAIAQDSGNRYDESHLAAVLCRLEAEHGDPLAALEYFALAIRNHHDSGNITMIRTPLAVLTSFLDRLGLHEPAAVIAGFTVSPLTATATPEIKTAIVHLRDVLGDRAYESLAREGETMTTAEMATYALDQIDQTRAELNAVSK